jgi:hypothetical protein
MTAPNVNERAEPHFSIEIQDQILTVVIAENELHIDLARLDGVVEISPDFVDQLLSRWLVDDWQSMTEPENLFLEQLSKIAEIDLKNTTDNSTVTITGADVLDLIKQLKAV